jgi:hypothetical protein
MSYKGGADKDLFSHTLRNLFFKRIFWVKAPTVGCGLSLLMVNRGGESDI